MNYRLIHYIFMIEILHLIGVNFFKITLFDRYKLCLKLLNYIQMNKNMGIADRVVRIIIAALVAVLYFTDIIGGTLGIVLLILAGVFLLTSLISFCPLYLPFRLNTRRRK